MGKTFSGPTNLKQREKKNKMYHKVQDYFGNNRELSTVKQSSVNMYLGQ